MPNLVNKVVTHMIIHTDESVHNTPSYVYAKQYDANSRFLVVRIVDSGGNINVTGASQLNATKPDGTSSYIAGSANQDGTITIGLTSNLLASVGQVACDITIFDTADETQALMTTSTFYIIVDKSNYDSDAIESTNEFTTVSAALNQIALDRAAAESARDDAEEAAEQVSQTLATKADGLVLNGSQLYLTSNGVAIPDSTVEIVTDLTAVYDAIAAKASTSDVNTALLTKADGFVIENNKLYLTSGTTKITDGVTITTDLTSVSAAIARRANGLTVVGNTLQLTTDDGVLIGEAITLPQSIADVEVGVDNTIYLVDDEGHKVGAGALLPTHAGGLMTTSDGENTTLYLTDAEGEQLGNGVILPQGGGGGGGSGGATNLVVTRITESPIVATKSDTINIRFSYSSTDGDGETVDGSYVWKLGSSIIASGTLLQGVNTFNATDFLSVGTQKFTLTVTDEGGNTAVKTWTVQVVDIRIESAFNDKITYEAGRTVNFSYTPYGSISKTIHFILDGTELESVTTGVSGSISSYTLPAQAHGAHLLECYITATINGASVETDHIYKDIIWYDETSTIPVIGCAYRYDHYGKVSNTQYNPTIIPYYVFDPNTGSPTVTRAADGSTVSTQTMTSSSDSWSFRTSTIGDHTLTLTCRSTVVTIMVEVSELGIDVNPVTGGIAFDFSPEGKSNNSATRLWTDTTNTNVQMTVSGNFDWNNGGYQIDSDGNQYFCVKAGTTASFSYNLFARNAATYGSEFKIIFKTTNVKNASTTFLNCMADTIPVGLQMNTHEAYFKSSTDSLYMPYSEDDIIEFEININAIDADDQNATGLIMSYEDGVGMRPMIYDSTHRLYQYTPIPITIGSSDCDVHIYRMKAYEVALSDSDILSNFIADSRDADTMISRYNRNQIYNENNVLTPDSVANACPQLRVIKIDCPHFTNDKKDYVKGTNVECIYKGGDAVLDNWKFVHGYHAGQGTTSNEYGYAGRNIDLIMCMDGQHDPTGKIKNLDSTFITELTLGDGTKVTDGSGAITLTRSSVPNNWFNIKVNIASSENANNALLQKRFNDFLPYVTPKRANTPEAKNSMEFVNCVVFLRENDADLSTHREFTDTEWHFYAIGNIGDSKKMDVTRVNDPSDLREFVIEVSDNTLANSTFQTGVTYESDVTDGNGNVIHAAGDMKYPILPSEWCAGNPKYDSLSGDGWDDSFEFRYDMGGGTKDGVITASSAEQDAQRLLNKQVFRDFYGWVITSTDAEFVAHLGDWCIRESMFYWYLFTLRYTMIDNRAKNTFWHWGKIYITQSEATALGTAANGYTVNDTAAAINGGYRFEMWDYDNDTAEGINNSGELTMPYGKEDTDYKTDGDPSSGYIFNAAESVFWCRIRDLCGSNLVSMYQQLDSENCWSDTGFINEFDNWQGQFPEELWRIDVQRKYYRTYMGSSIDNSIAKEAAPRFLRSMMNGRKKYQRRQFERDQAAYMGTKFLSTTITSDQIMFRCNTPVQANVEPDYTLTIVPYSDMYLSVKFGNLPNVNQVRAKAGITYQIPCPLQTMDDTAILIYCASRIQALNDLSTCYIHDNDFSKATKIQTLVIGSNANGYSNSFLTALNIGDNRLLETLDIRNCPNLTGSLNLTSCGNLTTLRAQGTSLTGVLFATSGKIASAYLPNTITSLSMKNLKFLTTLDVDYVGIETLTAENSVVDSQAIVDGAKASLKNLRLVGISWQVNDTTLLTAILGMISTYMSGTVHINGSIRSRDLQSFNTKWSDLTVTYDSFIEEYPVTFQNDDGTVLDVQWVARGSSAVNPVTRATDPIATPTKNSTVDTNYTFAAWDSNAYESSIYGAMIITATYTASVREYTVRWYVEGVLMQTSQVPYGSGVEYTGEEPVKTDNAEYDIYYLFTGWDQNYYRIYGDTDVHAVFVTGVTPAAPSDPDDKPAISTRSIAEINAICKAGQKDWENVYMNGTASSFEQQYFDIGDEIEVETGFDPDDTESNSHLIFDLKSSACKLHYSTDVNDEGIEVEGVTLPITLNQNSPVEGTTDRDPMYIDTGVELMYNGGTAFGDNDDYEFTWVLDFACNDTKIYGGTAPAEPRILDCMATNDGYDHGFRVIQNSTGDCSLKYAASSMTAAAARSIGSGSYLVTDPVTHTYTTTTAAMSASFLERLIVRKRKGERGVTVYRCSPTSTTYTTNTLSYSGNTRVAHDKTLWLGCGRSVYGFVNTATLCNCTIYNFKVWDVAMSDLEMGKMALAPKEKLTFRLDAYPRTIYGAAGSYNYLIANGTPTVSNPNPANIYPGISFGMKNLMRNYRTMNSTNVNTTGWENCAMRAWMSDRLYKSLPQVVRSAMKTVNVRASAGGGASTPPDSAYEIITSRDKLYLLSTREYGGYSGSPYADEGTQISLYTNDASRRKYQSFGHLMVYYYYWTRSPYLQSSAYFCIVYYNGNYNYANTAYNNTGVAAGFCV